MSNKVYAYRVVAEKLLSDIRAGIFDPEKRLPGCRQLGERYKVCMITARQAMNRLEQEGVLVSRKQRGTFIAPDFMLSGGKVRTYAVLYINSLLELLEHSFESWGIVTEIYSGIKQETAKYHIKLKFEHLPEKTDPLSLQSQAAYLEKYDGTIFLGSCSYSALFRLLEKQCPGKQVRLHADYYETVSRPNIIAFPYQAIYDTVAEKIAAAKYVQVDMVIGSFLERAEKFRDWKIKHLMNALRNRGGMSLNLIKGESLDELPRLLQPKANRLIYAFNTSAVPQIYQYASEHGLVPGRDFELIAFASGYTFANFYPSVSFFHQRYFEMGKLAVRHLLARDPEPVSLFPAFIQGQSTRTFPD